jgi:hypothetical protein
LGISCPPKGLVYVGSNVSVNSAFCCDELHVSLKSVCIVLASPQGCAIGPEKRSVSGPEESQALLSTV